MPVEFNFRPFVALGQAMAAADGMQLRVGMVGDKANEKEAGSDLSLADLALIHEYGTEDGHIPERAPVRKTFVAMADELTVDARKIAFASQSRLHSGLLTANRFIFDPISQGSLQSKR